MTDAVVAETEIKVDSTLSSTVFHSSLPYLQTKFVSEVPFYTNSAFNGQWYNYVWCAKLPNEAIDLINAGYRYTMLVRTKNSNNKWVSVGYGGRFSKWGKPYSPSDDTRYSYGCGPDSSNVWLSANTLSYTNCYVAITRGFPSGTTIDSMLGKVLAYAGYYDNRQDVVYGCKVLVYDLKNSTDTISIQSKGIRISPNEFSINTLNGTIDMKNFYPLTSLATQSADTFGSIDLVGNKYILPYIPDASSVVGWVIESDGTSPKISKKLVGGVLVQVSSNVDSKLSFSRTVRTNFNLTAQNSTAIMDITTIASNEVVFVEVNSTFYSAFAGNRELNGVANFIENGTTHSLFGGVTGYGSNGVDLGSYFSLETYVKNYVLKLKNITVPMAYSGEAGTFTGTLVAHILKIE